MKATPQQLKPHYKSAMLYIDAIRAASEAHGIPIDIIMGVGSRESAWGLLLKPPGPGGTGDYTHGRGLMQIDDRSHEFARTGPWDDPAQNIMEGCRILRGAWLAVAHGLGIGILEDCLGPALAAYNAGAGRVIRAVRRGEPWDSVTTGKDYSLDVLRRAGIFNKMLDETV